MSSCILTGVLDTGHRLMTPTVAIMLKLSIEFGCFTPALAYIAVYDRKNWAQLCENLHMSGARGSSVVAYVIYLRTIVEILFLEFAIGTPFSGQGKFYLNIFVGEVLAITT